MTCENNIMGSKKKLTKGMVIICWCVCIMISYGTFGMKIQPPKPSIEDVLPLEIVYKVLGEDKEFKKLIDGLNEENGYMMIEYPGCCCWRGNVLDAFVHDNRNNSHRSVYNLIYEVLDVKDEHSVQISNCVSTLSVDTGVYKYINYNSHIVDELNKAINPETIIKINEPYNKFKEGAEVTK